MDQSGYLREWSTLDVQRSVWIRRWAAVQSPHLDCLWGWYVLPLCVASNPSAAGSDSAEGSK
jgi:hypothetical protein